MTLPVYLIALIYPGITIIITNIWYINSMYIFFFFILSLIILPNWLLGKSTFILFDLIAYIGFLQS